MQAEPAGVAKEGVDEEKETPVTYRKKRNRLIRDEHSDDSIGSGWCGGASNNPEGSDLGKRKREGQPYAGYDWTRRKMDDTSPGRNPAGKGGASKLKR